jgi:hypothetical protein
LDDINIDPIISDASTNVRIFFEGTLHLLFDMLLLLDAVKYYWKYILDTYIYYSCCHVYIKGLSFNLALGP